MCEEVESSCRRVPPLHKATVDKEVKTYAFVCHLKMASPRGFIPCRMTWRTLTESLQGFKTKSGIPTGIYTMSADVANPQIGMHGFKTKNGIPTGIYTMSDDVANPYRRAWV